jgi:hypothetical protein
VSGIFISYRREDSAGHAGRLFDRLRDHFGKDRVFMDVTKIEPGEDFVDAIDRAVGACDILLAVIGRQWLNCADETGRRRLDNPNDLLRIETATALKRNVRVVPVLVQGAKTPPTEALPEDLKRLTRRQAVELRDTRWDADTADLIAVLEKILTYELSAEREPHPEQVQTQTDQSTLKPPIKRPKKKKQIQSEGEIEYGKTAVTMKWPSALGVIIGLVAVVIVGLILFQSSPEVVKESVQEQQPMEHPPSAEKTNIAPIHEQPQTLSKEVIEQTGKFIKYSDGTIADTTTNLMWMTKDFRSVEGRFLDNGSWDEAMVWADKMNGQNYAGYNDWRVPSIAEYKTICRNKADRKTYLLIFEDYGAYAFWSRNEVSKYVASYINFEDGFATSREKQGHRSMQTGEVIDQYGLPFKDFSVRLVRTVK